jgi:Mu transposase-like protein
MRGKGRVERQVDIVRAHVLAGRAFCSLAEMDAAFAGWAVIRRGQVHRTHGEVIGVRATADHAALRPLPAVPYLVAEQHLRRVGKDCLVWFEASLYSVPARQVRPFQTVQVRAAAGQVAIYALPGDGGGLLAVHARAPQRGSYVVEEAHWDGLPDGHTRAVTAGGPVLFRAVERGHGGGVSVAGCVVGGLSGGLVLRGLVDGVTVAV